MYKVIRFNLIRRNIIERKTFTITNVSNTKPHYYTTLQIISYIKRVNIMKRSRESNTGVHKIRTG